MIIDKIKLLRINIDTLARQIEDLNEFKLVEVKESLLYSKAWLGKCLQFLDDENPYKNDGKLKSVEDIEPAADKVIKYKLLEGNRIEKIDYVRTRIKEIVDEMEEGLSEDIYPGLLTVGFMGSYQHLVEARFGLGFYLEYLRDNRDK